MLNPRQKVLGLALLGYGFLWLILILAAGSVAAIVHMLLTHHHGRALFVKITIPLVFVAGYVLKALWPERVPPLGTLIRPSEAPELFAEIERMRSALKAPPIHQVRLTDELNASIRQQPRLGPLGWHRNILHLGLPYLILLPHAEFLSVVAHEIGHLSEKHGKLGAWIYRTHSSWRRLFEKAQVEHIAFIHPIVRWFFPFFERHALALKREHEREADAASAELVGAEPAAACLIRAYPLSRSLSGFFWPNVWRQAENSPSPKGLTPYSQLNLKTVLDQTPPEFLSYWTKMGLSFETSPDDTHPSVAERVQLLSRGKSLSIDWSDEATQSPAIQLLPLPLRSRSLQQLDEEWQTAVEEDWKKNYESTQHALEQIAALKKKVESQPLNEDEYHELLHRLRYNHRTPEALAILSQSPLPDGLSEETHKMHLALCRADGADPDAAPDLIELAKDPFFASAFYAEIENFLVKQGKLNELEEITQLAADHRRKLREDDLQRQSISSTDDFADFSNGDDNLMNHLRKLLAEMPFVRRAWALRKEITHFPERGIVVLIGIEVSASHLLLNKRDKVQNDIIQRLDLPSSMFLYVVQGNSDPLSQKIVAFPHFYVKA